MVRPVLLLTIALLLAADQVAGEEAKELPGDQVQFFETKVRPLLADKCFSCHGPDKQKSGLRLDSLGSAVAGGDSGPALVPSKPDESLLIEAIKYESLEMPPDAQLKPDQIATLTRWVEMGAPWPGAADAPHAEVRKKFEITDQDRQYWAFRPLAKPATPPVQNAPAVRSPIDAFVLARLEEKGLALSQPATRRELIRRAYYDLIGLPPSPEAVEAFVADQSPDSYEKLIDHLLAQPQYGERWGRHWLDVVRFGQTNGYERDDEKPEAWRYRDYVIKSLNDDKPYDQFVREQLAGDELDEVTDESLSATAFYRLGVWDDEPDDALQARFDELDDMVSTTGAAFLGVTIGCARCHDHKFDPIAQADYYGLLAFFANVAPYAKPDKKPTTIFADLKSGGKTLAVRESGTTPPPTHILLRGSPRATGDVVPPRFMEVLAPSKEAGIAKLPEKSVSGQTSGRRRVLADWIASPTNPLTARVIANRLWHYHFGRGIVATPNDFGKTGTPPTYPELLDYLATELIGGGWRLKRLHKQIMLSAVYQQSSRADNAMAVNADPANTLLWRQNMRRLEAEAIRDSVLAASGQLNLEAGGRGFFPKLPKEVLATQSRPGAGWDDSTEAERSRRSVYCFVKRTLGVPILETFDVASPDSSMAARTTTTIAPQALILLNSTFMDEQASAFAQRLIKEVGPHPAGQVERGFRLALGRVPTQQEMELAMGYLNRQQSVTAGGAVTQEQALASLCKLILNLNEFVYID